MPGEQFGLEWSLLAYSTIITLLITLAPFRFSWPTTVRFVWFAPVFDVITNIFLFLPLGFLFRLTRKPHSRTTAFQVLLLGMGFSAAIETAQLFLDSRYTSASDVVANAFGAYCGAGLCGWAQRVLSREWIGRLGLELPLLNIVYLLIPLIWLDGLSIGDDRPRGRLVWLLGLCGSIVIGSVYRHGLRRPQAVRRRTLVIITAGWFVASSLPAALSSVSILVIGSLLVAAAVIVVVTLPSLDLSHERRFELPVIKRVLPFYSVYLLLLVMWPMPTEYVGWRGAWGFADLSDDPSITSVLQLMEHFAAFTLLGYMVAESHGRREISMRTSLWWSCFWCAVAATLLIVSSGFNPNHTASAAEALLLISGSVGGAAIYWRQLAWIRRVFN
jgi:glycopeptide antibiotics resistance protein